MENSNRLNDLYFKKLLGDKKRKNLTLSFLNGILNKDDEYPDSKVTIPSLESVLEAKDWVDNGSKT